MNDLVLFYKIVYKLVNINLPSEFEVVNGNNLRYTLKTSVIIDAR